MHRILSLIHILPEDALNCVGNHRSDHAVVHHGGVVLVSDRVAIAGSPGWSLPGRLSFRDGLLPRLQGCGDVGWVGLVSGYLGVCLLYTSRCV